MRWHRHGCRHGARHDARQVRAQSQRTVQPRFKGWQPLPANARFSTPPLALKPVSFSYRNEFRGGGRISEKLTFLSLPPWLIDITALRATAECHSLHSRAQASNLCKDLLHFPRNPLLRAVQLMSLNRLFPPAPPAGLTVAEEKQTEAPQKSFSRVPRRLSQELERVSNTIHHKSPKVPQRFAELFAHDASLKCLGEHKAASADTKLCSPPELQTAQRPDASGGGVASVGQSGSPISKIREDARARACARPRRCWAASSPAQKVDGARRPELSVARLGRPRAGASWRLRRWHKTRRLCQKFGSAWAHKMMQKGCR